MRGEYRHTAAVPGRFVAACLFCCFALGYIAGPYWAIPSSLAWRALLLGITVYLSIWWARQAGADLEYSFPGTRDLFLLLILAAVLLALNWRALTAPIPMRGDEDYHISVLLNFAVKGRATIFFHLPFIILIFLFLASACRKTKYTVLFGIGTLAYFILFGLSGQVFPDEILRYPFFSRPFQIIPLLLTSEAGGLYSEPVYRILPFLSAVILGWITVRSRPFPDSLLNIMVGIAVGTMPLVFYYSSLLYLEMPAVVLMLIVCFHLDLLLHGRFQEVTSHPAWYALLLIGFIKETTIVFLFVLLIFRMIVQVRLRIDSAGQKAGTWREEYLYGICVLMPIAVYLLYRAGFGTTRNTSFAIHNLLQPEAYIALARSFPEQFGFFCILFLAGIYLMIKDRKIIPLCFALAVIVSSTLFYIAENPKWAGYSRFNLFSLPAVIFVSAESVYRIRNRKKIAAAVLGIVIAVNLFLSPVNPDGSKKPLWGNYLVDTSEHYYPYREAIQWLKENHTKRKLLFAGMRYPYFFSFYFNRFNWNPVRMMMKADYRNDEKISLSKALATADAYHFDILIFQFRGENGIDTEDKYGYRLVKRFENQAHLIGVYRK